MSTRIGRGRNVLSEAKRVLACATPCGSFKESAEGWNWASADYLRLFEIVVLGFWAKCDEASDSETKRRYRTLAEEYEAAAYSFQSEEQGGW